MQKKRGMHVEALGIDPLDDAYRLTHCSAPDKKKTKIFNKTPLKRKKL
jgi:hypothetical protein